MRSIGTAARVRRHHLGTSAVLRLPRTTLVLALLGAALVQPARSADLRPSLPPPPLPPEAIEIASGWYLRADFTESFYDRPKDATLVDPANPVPPLTRLRLSSESGYGGGVGYKINDWLRVDITVDQRLRSSFSTYSSGSNFRTGYNVEAGQLDALTGLVNVYADLGTWWGLTPYIGGGVGFAEKSFRRGYTQTTCILDSCDGVPGTGSRDPVKRPDRSVTTLAWALSGGVSYAIGGGFSVDASYRYVNLGRAKSGVDDFGYDTRLKEVTANEVRVGLRYMLTGGPDPVRY
jgi:opacity protein-like surface antigen